MRRFQAEVCAGSDPRVCPRLLYVWGILVVSCLTVQFLIASWLWTSGQIQWFIDVWGLVDWFINEVVVVLALVVCTVQFAIRTSHVWSLTRIGVVWFMTPRANCQWRWMHLELVLAAQVIRRWIKMRRRMPQQWIVQRDKPTRSLMPFALW